MNNVSDAASLYILIGILILLVIVVVIALIRIILWALIAYITRRYDRYFIKPKDPSSKFNSEDEMLRSFKKENKKIRIIDGIINVISSIIESSNPYNKVQNVKEDNEYDSMSIRSSSAQSAKENNRDTEESIEKSKNVKSESMQQNSHDKNRSNTNIRDESIKIVNIESKQLASTQNKHEINNEQRKNKINTDMKAVDNSIGQIVDIVKPIGKWTALILGQKLTHILSHAAMMNNKNSKGFWVNTMEAQSKDYSSKQRGRG